MKSFVFLFAFFCWCYGDQLLGGWKTSSDAAFIQDCLKLALVNIHGAQVGDDVQSQVSNVDCKTQIVNGLNIRLTFNLRGQKWKCTFYKSFMDNLETQLERCKTEPDETTTTSSIVDKENEEQQLALQQPVVVHENRNLENNEDEDEDEEAKIDALKEKMVENEENEDQNQ